MAVIVIGVGQTRTRFRRDPHPRHHQRVAMVQAAMTEREQS